MAAETFKCPNCGAYINFNPNNQDFKCPYCGTVSSKEEILKKAEQYEEKAETTKTTENSNNEKEKNSGDNTVLYSCKNCGAQIVTTETTSATFCYFCHSPIVLTDRLSNENKPDRLIPFKISKDKALKQFKSFIEKKKYIPAKFFEKSQLEKMSGVYYPYWSADFKGNGRFEGEGTRVSTIVMGDYNVTTTKYYKVIREANMKFNDVMRSALKKNERRLADGIHPFDQQASEDFSSAYLSGFVAENKDLEREEVESDINSEVEGYVKQLLTRDSSYVSLNGECYSEFPDRKFEYYLLPTWVLTYNGTDKKNYYYSMNGQSGNVCGELPIDKKKLFAHSSLIALAITIVLCIGGYFLW